jgi:hypothetical protein
LLEIVRLVLTSEDTDMLKPLFDNLRDVLQEVYNSTTNSEIKELSEECLSSDKL